MQRLQFSIKGRTLVVFDRVNGGSLHISFNRKGKFEISPTFEAWNDLEVAINSGELDLILLGYSTIREYDGFILKRVSRILFCPLSGSPILVPHCLPSVISMLYQSEFHFVISPIIAINLFKRLYVISTKTV